MLWRRTSVRLVLLPALALVAIATVGCGGQAHTAGERSAKAPKTGSAQRHGPLYTTADADFDADDEHPPAHAGFDDGPLLRQYGHRAAPALAHAVAAAVRRYYAAALAGSGVKVCALLSPAFAQALASESSQAATGAGACAAAASRQLAEQHSQIAREDPSTMRIKAVYSDGQIALAVLSLRSAPESAISLAREQGVWRVSTLFASYMR